MRVGYFSDGHLTGIWQHCKKIGHEFSWEKGCLGVLYKKIKESEQNSQRQTMKSRQPFLTLSTNVRYSVTLPKRALDE
jgi:hypothetical protein